MLGDDIRVNQLYMIFLASPYALLVVLGRWDVAPWILGAGESARITLLTMITLKVEVAFLAKVSSGYPTYIRQLPGKIGSRHLKILLVPYRIGIGRCWDFYRLKQIHRRRRQRKPKVSMRMASAVDEWSIDR